MDFSLSPNSNLKNSYLILPSENMNNGPNQSFQLRIQLNYIIFSSSLIAKMKVTSLRRDPVYHTAYVVCNTIVMGE